MNYSKSIIRWMFSLATVLLACACTEDNTSGSDGQYGYVQFQMLQKQTRSGQLEYLREAAKVRVNLIAASGDQLSQTLNLTTYDNSTAEYGLQSDKWMLVPDNYTVAGYELYDGVEKLLLTVDYPEAERPSIQVVPNGLHMQELFVNVLGRGQVRFHLAKDTSELDTRAGGADTYPFLRIQWADVTVRNLEDNKETTFEKLRMTYKSVWEDRGDEEDYQTGICTCDSLLTLPSGNYRVVSFKTFFDLAQSNKLAEYCSEVADNGFTVTDYGKTTAKVPVTLHEASDYLKDAYALYEIWKALDGPNWHYKGMNFPKGTNWKFDGRDLDLWLAQPGVSVLSNGRVASISLEGFGAKGDMPADLGQLTELRSLLLGTHTYNTSYGSNLPMSANVPSVVTEEDLARQAEALRQSFSDMYEPNEHPLECFSEPMRRSFELVGLPQVEGRPSTLGPYTMKKSQSLMQSPLRTPIQIDPQNYATQIYSLPEEIGNLKKLSDFFYAYGPLSKLPDGIVGCETIRNFMLYACPNLTEFPPQIAKLPSLSGLHFAENKGVDATQMRTGLQLLNTEGGKMERGYSPLQILQIPGQPCEYLPDLCNLKRLGVLDIQYCGMKYIEKAFGKNFFFIKFLGRNNEFDHLPKDDEGYFAGLHSDFESLDLSHNKFTELPDIFLGNSIFILKTVDFSFNQISALQGGSSWRGINVEIFNLSYNDFTEFPRLFTPGNDCSQISFLQLQGNHIETIEEHAFEGRCSHWLTSLDLSMNKLTEIPVSLNGKNLPYFYGLDLSYNRFESFMYQPLNCGTMVTYIFSGQHDAKGNRCMREWPANILNHVGLRTLTLSSNDIRMVPDKIISNVIYLLDIRDNPNITIDVSSVCPYIMAGRYILLGDREQDIRGCDAIKFN